METDGLITEKEFLVEVVGVELARRHQPPRNSCASNILKKKKILVLLTTCIVKKKMHQLFKIKTKDEKKNSAFTWI